MDIRVDDLSDPRSLALLDLHLRGMLANSPPDNVFALGREGLRKPEVTVWTAWDGDALCGMAALRHLDAHRGELKSMRTHPEHLRQGVASQLLIHLIGVARLRGWHTLSLETGRGESFEAALALYRAAGFAAGPAFGNYQPNDFSQFLHLDLRVG